MGKFTQGEMLLMLLNIQKGLMPTHVTHDLDLGNSSYSKEKNRAKKINLIWLITFRKVYVGGIWRRV